EPARNDSLDESCMLPGRFAVSANSAFIPVISWPLSQASLLWRVFAAEVLPCRIKGGAVCYDSRRSGMRTRAASVWSARELMAGLGYRIWLKFKPVIEKASLACDGSGHETSDHMSHVEQIVTIGSGAQRKIEDYHLTRYACYLIAQNADPDKP